MVRLLYGTLGLIFGIAAIAPPAYGGPLMPCVSATLSANGSTLVVNELTFGDPDVTHGRMPRTSTFRVFHRYSEVNEGLRMNGPDRYWTDPLWSVVFDSSDGSPVPACPYLLVTDDGEYLIFIGSRFERSALSIYRRRDHPGQPFGGPGPDHGVLVRQIPLSDLWPPKQIPEVITDHTPQWFASGTFAFSPDSGTLIYKTRWGKTLQISLETGKVSGQ